MKIRNEYDVVIVGGGFYGSFLSYYLCNYFKNILIIEKEKDLLMGASLNNQGRVHNGYHYPRSFLTAYRSHINFEKFVKEFDTCINTKIKKLYALPKYGNKITALQFVNFCKRVGIPAEPVSDKMKNFFDKRLISEVFEVQEYIFDPNLLRDIMKKRIFDNGINTLLESAVKKIGNNRGMLQVDTEKKSINARIVFNCTYSQINHINKNSFLQTLPLKHELTEMIIVEIPEILKQYGITLVDGPFFSILPYTGSQYHILSHVRFTPQYSWSGIKSDSITNDTSLSQAQFIIKDAMRYIPILQESNYIKSIYEVKTVLLSNEDNDGRPILFQKDFGFNNYHIIMGGKIDNIYDVIETIRQSDVISRFQ